MLFWCRFIGVGGPSEDDRDDVEHEDEDDSDSGERGGEDGGETDIFYVRYS